MKSAATSYPDNPRTRSTDTTGVRCLAAKYEITATVKRRREGNRSAAVKCSREGNRRHRQVIPVVARHNTIAARVGASVVQVRNNKDWIRIFYLKIEPPRPPFATRRGALEGDVSQLQAIPKQEIDTSGYLFRFHPAQLIVEAEEVKKRLYPNVGLTKIGEDTEEGDGIGVQMEQGKAVEIQDEKKEENRKECNPQPQPCGPGQVQVQYLLFLAPWSRGQGEHRRPAVSSGTHLWRWTCRDPSPPEIAGDQTEMNKLGFFYRSGEGEGRVEAGKSLLQADFKMDP
uniref:Uncharacterized protein n=1 Tax=Oryza sativa subsp. japonica TaxID=39947 RepID=Q2R465_ORYSJ|nr:hypothetical protein LOC_Os11g29550 [Oryza sativa Japonica Group]